MGVSAVPCSVSGGGARPSRDGTNRGKDSALRFLTAFWGHQNLYYLVLDSRPGPRGACTRLPKPSAKHDKRAVAARGGHRCPSMGSRVIPALTRKVSPCADEEGDLNS